MDTGHSPISMPVQWMFNRSSMQVQWMNQQVQHWVAVCRFTSNYLSDEPVRPLEFLLGWTLVVSVHG